MRLLRVTWRLGAFAVGDSRSVGRRSSSIEAAGSKAWPFVYLVSSIRFRPLDQTMRLLRWFCVHDSPTGNRNGSGIMPKQQHWLDFRQHFLEAAGKPAFRGQIPFSFILGKPRTKTRWMQPRLCSSELQQPTSRKTEFSREAPQKPGSSWEPFLA